MLSIRVQFLFFAATAGIHCGLVPSQYLYQNNKYIKLKKNPIDIGRVHVKKPVEKTSGLNRWLVKKDHWVEKN